MREEKRDQGRKSQPVSKDRRVIKTRKAIHRAFAELIAVRDISEITVKDIAELANINRKTFYNHYTDINELVDDVENEIVMAFDSAMSGINIRKALRDPEELSKRLLAIGYNCSDLCSHLMNITYNGDLVDKIAHTLKASILKSPTELVYMDEADLDMLMEFAVAGMLQTYQMWFNSDKTEPIEDLTRRVCNIIVYGVNGMIPKK